MKNCDKCTKSLTKKVPGVECSRCGTVVHVNQACTGLTAKQLSALRNSESIGWTCEECQKSSPLSKSSIIIPEDDDEDAENAGICSIDTNKLLAKVKKMIIPMETSITAFINKIDQLTQLVESQNLEIIKLRKNYIQLNTEKTLLEQKVITLSSRVNNIEQQQLENIVEISGIPKNPNEDVVEIISKISKSLDMDSRQIKNIKRKVDRNKQDANIILKFNDGDDAAAWLRASKDKPVLLNEVVSNPPSSLKNSTVFMRRALTPSNKSLLWNAQQKLKPTYKYIWFQNGKILARKSDTDKPKVITSEEDINKLSGLGTNHI